jgi:hypothetical protein
MSGAADKSAPLPELLQSHYAAGTQGTTNPVTKKVLPPGGGRTFVESISLSSTDLADFRLPATASVIGFGLLASRTRRTGDTTDRQRDFQDPSGTKFAQLAGVA